MLSEQYGQKDSRATVITCPKIAVLSLPLPLPPLRTQTRRVLSTPIYCGDDCAQPLYSYFRDCDVPGSKNATTFDFFCSSNAAGNRCLPQLFGGQVSFTSSCADPIQETTCDDTCKTALAAAYDVLGCCLFSYYAVIGDLEGADALFTFCSEDPNTLCTGGVSGETLQFPTPAVNPECEEFVDDVDDSCRYLLSEDILGAALFSLDDTCGDKCGPDLYQFSRDCDEKTESSNASAIDALCAVNDKGQRCGEFFLQIAGVTTACADIEGLSCPEKCRNALEQAQEMYGCCLPSLASVFFGEDFSIYATFLSTLCGVQFGDECAGRFTGNDPTDPPPTNAMCNNLRNAIPAVCQPFSNIYYILLSASSDPDGFQTKFCKSECAGPVYDYINECVNKTEATILDFLCSTTPAGTNCANIANDTALDTALDGVCKDASNRQCSQGCQSALEGFNKVYGCCLFTSSALDTNVTYTNGLWAQCGADNPGLCTGGITNTAVGAPEGEVESSALATALGSTLLLILSLIADVIN